MNKLFTTLFALGVACATNTGWAQSAPAPVQKAPAAVAPAQTQPPASGGSIQTKVAMCIGCHGIHGYQSSFPEVHKVPKISGQSAKYIAAALNAYRTGDRKHPTMRGIAQSLSEQDIADVSNFYAGQLAQPAGDKAADPNSRVAQLLQKGNCASCHGANFSKPIDPSYPKIAGQHADYLFVALKSYKVQNNQAWGRNNGVMGAIAAQFSNAELKELSNYMAGLQGELSVQPESRFR